jgi:hypothetical protein
VVLKVPAGGVRAKKIANANTSNVKIAKGITILLEVATNYTSYFVLAAEK